MRDYMGHFGFFPFGLLGGLAGLLFFAGLVLLIVWLIREMGTSAASRPAALTAPAPPAVMRETPYDVLARRFAAGDISAEEFQKARDLLNQGPGQ